MEIELKKAREDRDVIKDLYGKCEAEYDYLQARANGLEANLKTNFRCCLLRKRVHKKELGN